MTVVAGLFGVVLAFGTLARVWSGPARLLGSAGTWGATGLGALGAVLINNLPAAMLLSAHAPTHPRALLIGLNLGPNLAVTGSLSAVLWFRAARAVGADASARTFSRIGLALAPLGAAAALVSLRVFGTGRL
jgi:arsenical pump membrane protein